MKIVANVNGVMKEAYRIKGVYKCFPQGTNKAADAKEFDRIEDAAAWLKSHSGWGIRMNPGSAIIYRGIKFLP